MKKFDFVEFFYDAMREMTNEQKGQFITVLSEYYFNGVKKFPDVDKSVIGAVNMAINYNKKQNNGKVDFTTYKWWASEVLTWCKDNYKIQTIKNPFELEEGFGGVQEEVEKNFPDIPSEQVVKILTWIRDKYDEKFYL